MKKRAVVAMSSGVDSSTCALLAKEKGYEVVGVHFLFTDKKWYDDDNLVFTPEVNNLYSRDEKECKQAEEVANFIGIDFRVEDISDIFRKKVIDYFLKEYSVGRTPNPCVTCNREVKMKLLFQTMKKFDCDVLMTGHYANVQKDGNGIKLCRAENLVKDQSYVLSQVPKEILESTQFPLGKFKSKDEVRAIAESYNIPTFAKKDSYDICFINKNKVTDFLKNNIPAKPGDIVDEEGNVLAEHGGCQFFTIAQRKGLNIRTASKTGNPRYVLRIDIDKNQVVAGEKEKLIVNKIETGNVVYLDDGFADADKFDCLVQIRAHAKPAEAVVYNVRENADENSPCGDNILKSGGNEVSREQASERVEHRAKKQIIVFKNRDLYGASLGQFAVCYTPDNKRAISSGTIEKTE